jgi:hypothetical protein
MIYFAISLAAFFLVVAVVAFALSGVDKVAKDIGRND